MQVLGNLFILAAIIGCSTTSNLSPIANAIKFIENEGYPAQKLTAITRDGYILDIFRIPGTPEYKEEWDNSSKEQTGKRVILLMHGIMGSAEEFIAGGQYRGLAFKLADRGFDIFMGNVRGSKYGREHTQLRSNEDSQFWDFCWHDIALDDLPAIIDQITSVTGQKKMHYIGYNQGNTIFYILASMKPQYNSKIRKMIALGPAVFLRHGTNPLLSKIRDNLGSKHWLTKNVGNHEFTPSDHLKNEIKPDCINKDIDENICDNFYFLLNGYSVEFNQSIVPQVASRPTYGIPVKSILHYAQLLDTAHFRPYVEREHGYDSSNEARNPQTVEEYDLDAVVADNYILYVPNDAWSNKQDVNSLSSRLPNLKEITAFKDYASNVDLLLAKDAYVNVHERILNILQ